jgi:hypothetical protein
VLLEDYWGGNMGFDLDGTVSANGLMPAAAKWNGTDVSFAPCSCDTGHPGPAQSQAMGTMKRANENADDDSAVVQAIIKIAEDHRRRAQQEPPSRQ